jgi:hypothetical protein
MVRNTSWPIGLDQSTRVLYFSIVTIVLVVAVTYLYYSILSNHCTFSRACTCLYRVLETSLTWSADVQFHHINCRKYLQKSAPRWSVAPPPPTSGGRGEVQR